MPLPPIAELTAASGWHAVDCISDLHLDAAHPATLQGLATYLGHTAADAVLILGDLFEVWVGDDAIAEPGSFEAEVCALLRQARRQRALPVSSFADDGAVCRSCGPAGAREAANG